MKHSIKLRVTLPGSGSTPRVEKVAFSLGEGRSISVGRETKRLTLRDPSVSKIHCKLLIEHGKLYIQHEASSGTTKVNDRPVTRARIKPQDKIQLGQAMLEVLEAPIPKHDEEPDTLFIEADEETAEISQVTEVTAPPVAKPVQTKSPSKQAPSENVQLQPRRPSFWNLKDRRAFVLRGRLRLPRSAGALGKVLLVLGIGSGAYFYVARMSPTHLDFAQITEAPMDRPASMSPAAMPNETARVPASAPAAATVQELKKFFVSAQRGDLANLRALMERGVATANTVSPNGTTPLMLASYGGHTQVVGYLLANGAQLDAQDAAGMTALMWAATGTQAGTLQQLLQAGANAKLKNDSGERASDIMARLNPAGPARNAETALQSDGKKVEKTSRREAKKKSDRKAEKRSVARSTGSPKRSVSSTPTVRPAAKVRAVEAAKRPKAPVQPPAPPRNSAAEFSDKFFGE